MLSTIDEERRMMTIWNQFQRKNAGQGWTKEKMKAEYYKMKREEEENEVERRREEMCKEASVQYVRRPKLPPSDWDKFQSEEWTKYGSYDEMRAAFDDQQLQKQAKLEQRMHVATAQNTRNDASATAAPAQRQGHTSASGDLEVVSEKLQRFRVT